MWYVYANLYVNLSEGINCYKSLPKQKTIIEDPDNIIQEKNLVIANKFCQSLAWSFVIYIEVPPYQNEQFLTYYMIRVWRPRAAHLHQNFP